MPHLLADKGFERDALDFFPTPLADTLDEAVSESSFRAQRDKIVETFRVGVRLLGLLALAGLSDPGLANSQLKDFLKKLLRQGLTDGEWIGLARETVRPFAATPKKFALPPLVATFFQGNGKPASVFAQQCACDKLLAMRKSDTVAHGVTGTEETAQDVLAARLPDLEAFLKALDWLGKFSVLVPMNRSARPDGTPEYSVLKLMGVTPRRGFRPEQVVLPGEMCLSHVYGRFEDGQPIELYPLVQYADSGPGEPEVFLFEEVGRHEAVLRAYPTGQKRSDPEALTWLRTRFSHEQPATPPSRTGSQVAWSLEQLRDIARRASNDYLDKMQRERIYLPHLYARRLELEVHLSGFLDRNCTKTGMLIVGASGIGKTNTLCHTVKSWRDDAARLSSDIVLIVGGSTLPGGQFSLRDVLLDRLELSENFTTFVSAMNALRRGNECQLVLVVDGVDKHPQPAELLRQLDELVIRSEALKWLKIIISIGEVTYSAIRKAGFIPALRDYYTVSVKKETVETELAEITLGRMTDAELEDAYQKYRQDPRMSPTSEFTSLTEDVKNAIRIPLFLKIVMEVFNGRKIPRRTLTAEVLLEFCNKKIFSHTRRTYFISRLIDVFYGNKLMAVPFDSIAQESDLREMVLDTSPESPYLQLLDEQVLEEQLKRVSAILPPQRTIAFTYDRLLEYLLLNRIAERFGTRTEIMAGFSNEAADYLPVRGVLVMFLLAKTDEGAFDDVAVFLKMGNADVMKSVGLTFLMELEQAAPTIAETSEIELAEGPVGKIIRFLLFMPQERIKRLLADFGEKLQQASLYRRAGFVYERLIASMEESSEPQLAAEVWRQAGAIQSVFGRKHVALEYYNKSLQICRDIGDRAGVQAVLDAIGEVYLELGEMSTARIFFEQSLVIDQELAVTGSEDAKRGEAKTLLNLSNNFLRTGELASALDWAQKARQCYSSVNDMRGLAASLSRIGELYRRQGLIEEGRKYYEEALAIRQRIGDKNGIAGSFQRLGLNYHTGGNWTEAVAMHEKALSIFKEIGDKYGIADSLVCIGESHRWEGELDAARNAYEQALELYSEMGASFGIALCLNNLGATCLFAGNAEKAMGFLKQTRALQKEKLGIEGKPECLAYLSAAALQLGNTEDAFSFSETALDILKSRQFSTEDIQLTYYYRYKILAAMGRKIDALAALKIAYDDVMKQAEAIKDARTRQSFLQSFPLRRQVMEAWQTDKRIN